MIQIAPQMRILVAVEAVDGRKGIDSLAQLCQEELQEDPFSGCLFRSRRGRLIRILTMMAKGSASAEAALQGRLVWWPSGKKPARRLQRFPRPEIDWLPNAEQSAICYCARYRARAKLSEMLPKLSIVSSFPAATIFPSD